MSRPGAGKTILVVLVWMLLFAIGTATYFGLQKYRAAGVEAEFATLKVRHEQLRRQGDDVGLKLDPWPEATPTPDEFEALAGDLEEQTKLVEAWQHFEELSWELDARGESTEQLPRDTELGTLRGQVRTLKQLRDNLVSRQGGSSAKVRLALDSFSGYFLFRSREFRERLFAHKLDVEPVDDGADYAARVRSLESGDTPLAVFTIDAWIKAARARGGTNGETPGSIVLIIDETTGADAMVAYEKAIPNLDALNRSDARIVATPDSPSETLARVVRAHFDLPLLSTAPWVPADGARDVYEKLIAADPDLPRVYVLWEPFVSKALEHPGTHLVTDSGRFRGYIVDVLVAQKEYLRRHPERVAAFVGAYLKTRQQIGSNPQQVTALLLKDARRLQEDLTPEQAGRLTQGIHWKNSQENFAHFGLLPEAQARGTLHVRDIASNIREILRSTGAISEPTDDAATARLEDSSVLRDVQADWLDVPAEQIPEAPSLRPLSATEVESLETVGLFKVAPLGFSRGGSRLTIGSKATLRALAKKLKTWPGYYLIVRGQARSVGDAEANRRLAQDRADAAAKFLIQAGTSPHRVYAVSLEPTEAHGSAQAVSFDLGRLP